MFNFMKKKKIIYIFLLLVIIWGVSYWGYYYKYKLNNTDTEVVWKDVYHTAWTWDLVSSIKVLWETSLLQEQYLNFNNEWTIAWVYVKQWQKVKAWDLLAELDKWQLKNELKEANIKLENSKITLQKTLDKFGNEDKTKALIDLESKKKALDLAEYNFTNIDKDQSDKLFDETKKLEKLKIDLDNQIKNIEIEKQKLIKNLDTTKNDLEFKVKSLWDDKWKLQNSITEAKRNLENKLQDYDLNLKNSFIQIDTDIRWVKDSLEVLNAALRTDSELKKQEQNIYFSAKNNSYKNKAESYYWKVKSWLYSLETKYWKYNIDNVKIENIIDLTKEFETIYDNLSVAAEYTAKWAEYSLVTEDFPQWEVDSIKSQSISIKNSYITKKNSIDSEINKLKFLDTKDVIKEKSRIEIENLEKQLKELEPNLEKAKLDYLTQKNLNPDKIKELEINLETAKKNYQKAKQDFETFKFNQTLEKKDAELNIKQLELDYENLQKDFNRKYSSKVEPEEIVFAKNEVKQAEIGVDQVNKKIENYELRAPFDGQVDNFTMKVGDKLAQSSSENWKIQVVNPNLMEIKLKLDQIDIVKVKKWMETLITFDSYPDKVFTWALWSIDSKPIDDWGTKKYQVKLVIDKWDLNIFTWMSANVEIVLEKINNAVLVPSMAIENNPETMENYVTLLKNWKKVKQIVETGINSNWQTQVISWVKPWDQVLEINFDANQFKVEDFNQPGYGWMY